VAPRPRSLPLQGVPARSPDFPGNLRGVYRGDWEEGSQSENPPSRSAPSILSRRTRSPCSSGPRLGSSATSTRTRILRNRSLSSSAAWRLPKGGTAVCSRKRKKTRTAAPPSRRCRLEKAKSYFPPGSKTLSARKRTHRRGSAHTRSTSELDKTYSAHKTYTVPPQILPPCSPGISLEDA